MHAHEFYSDPTSPTNPDDELELFGEEPATAEVAAEGSGDEEDHAWELLSVQNEAELEAFLGKLFRSAKRAATPMLGKLLRGGAKSLLKRALPALGAVVGSAIPIPGVGTMLGGMAGTAASQLLGNEAEALSEPEAEMEVARRLVRTIGEAAARVGNQGASAGDPRAVVTQAFRAAMQRNVPMLLAGRSGSPTRAQPARSLRATAGRWERRGDVLLVLGV